MKIEHVAFQVAEPAAMADWYVQHLGFCVRRAGDGPVVARFMADSSGSVMLEVYFNPKVPLPDYAAMDPALLHVAFMCDDVPAAHRAFDRRRGVTGPRPGDSWRGRTGDAPRPLGPGHPIGKWRTADDRVGPACRCEGLQTVGWAELASPTSFSSCSTVSWWGLAARPTLLLRPPYVLPQRHGQ